MIEIKPRLKVLILEDDPLDTILIQELIKKEISGSEFFCVSGKSAYKKALTDFHPDIVLSDNCFPEFTATEALGILKQQSVDTPFILVTGSLSEDAAVNLIEQGANDYILKDRMARLPMAIESALKQKRANKEIIDYRNALDQAAIVFITNRQGTITYVNENCCKISGYSAAELIGQRFHLLHPGFQQLTSSPKKSTNPQPDFIRQGEFRNLSKDGDYYWVHTLMIPFLDENNEPSQYLAISNDITERKQLENTLLEQQHNEELRMTAIALAAQEKERTIIGQELHDNVNQILVATRLLLSLVIQRTGGTDELLKLCSDHIYNAIEENRKIARVLVGPNLETETLPEQLKMLSESMLSITGLKTHIDASMYNEELLSKAQKLALYRISQEQSTNIVKYAAAKNVFITLQTCNSVFKMTITDDGRGTCTSDKTKGVGLKNIGGRIGIFNGTATSISTPGNGYTLQIEMPLAAQT